MKHLLTTTAAAAVLFWAAPSHAVLQIAAEINGFTYFCADQQACDTSGAIGILSTGPVVIGGVQFNGSEQTQTIGPPSNTLTTTSVSIVNNTGALADIQFAVGATDYAFPTDSFSASGSGTWLNAAGSTIDMSWYGDTANQQGASTVNDLPGVLLTSSPLIQAGPGTDAFSFTDTGPWVTSGLYSWTMGADGTLISGATVRLIGRSQDITSTVVPEPGSLALIGSMLLGMGWMIRRRTRKES